MKKFTFYDTGEYRTRKTKRWLGWLTFCMMLLVGQMSLAQCINGTSYLTVTSNNSGDVQSIGTCMFTSEYNNLSSFVIGEDYIFTATQSGVDVYITITDTSNTVIEHGPSPLTVNNITASSVRLHATNDAACGSSSTCTATTMQFILSCPQPVSLTAFNTSENSADLEWTEEGTATAWDIEWGTLGFIPTGTPTITGVTTNPYTLTGLTTATSYQFYVRSDCGVDDGTSIWSGPFAFQTTADCSAYTGDITSTVEGNVCNEGTTTLQATATGVGSEVYWYDAEVGGNLVGEGTSFETPFLTETTSYWASEVLLDNELFTGQGNLSPTTLGSTTAGGITFVLNQSASILSFEARSTTAAGGAVTYALIDVDNGNSVLMTHSDTLPGGGTAAAPALYTVNLNFLNIPPGTYRLVKQSGAASAYMTGVFPYPLGTVGSITNGAGSATTTSTLYYHFFNITVEGVDVICASEREEVIATVHEIIDIDVTSTDTELLPGESATLSASSTNTNYIYEWTWDGGSTTGASVTVSPTAISTIYTVTATDTVTGCETQGSIEIFTFDPALCDDLEIATTIDGNVCDPGNTTTLQATGSSSMGDAQIFWYDAPTGGNKVGQGEDFTTPALTTTTSYWASEVLTDGQEDLPGQGWTTDYGTLGVGTTRQGLIFEIFEHTTLVDLEVWSTGAGGVVDIELYDMANVVVGNHLELVTTTLATGTAATPAVNTVTLNWELAPGVYKIVRAGSVPCRYISGVANFGGGYPIPFDNGIGQITAGSNTFASTGYATDSYYFVNL